MLEITRSIAKLSLWAFWRILKWVLSIALLALFLYFAYTITRPTLLEFVVYDAKTGAVLPDTVIEVQNANGQKIVQLVTDQKGWAGVKRLIPGTGYRALARHIDYVQAERRGVEVKLHKTVSVKMPLRSKSGGRLYVGMQRAYVAVIDTASYLFVSLKKGPEELGESSIQEILVHPERPWLYISARIYRSYMLGEPSLELMAKLPVSGAARNLFLSQDGKSLWATVSNGGTGLAVLDAYSATVTSLVKVPFASPNVRVLFPNKSQEAFVLDGSSSVWTMDILTGNRLARVPLRFRPTWAIFSPDETQLYVGSPDNEQMIRLDTRQRQLARPISVGQGVSAIAVHPAGKQLYLANSSMGLLLILDATTLETVAYVPVGRRPIAIVVDPQGERVYVANADSQDISVMDVQSRQIVETIRLELAPLCMAVR